MVSKQWLQQKFLIVFYIALVSFEITSCSPMPTPYVPSWKEARTTHNLVPANNIVRLLWKCEVFTAQNVTDIEMVAVHGKVFFIGSVQKDSTVGFIALDGISGDVLWRRPTTGGTLSTNSNALYLGDGPWIYSLDFNSGNEFWSVQLAGLHTNIIYLYTIDNTLYIAATNKEYYHFLNAESGEKFDTEQFSSLVPLKWLQDIPTITNDKIFFGVGRNIADSASAFQLYSYYEKLWETAEKNVISNVAASEKVAYFITYENEIKMVDSDTGEDLGVIYIEPSIDFFENQGASQHDGYHIAVDGENNLLYIILGDSNQMFAFQILLDAEVE